MTFTIKVKQKPLTVTFEAGSLSEAAAILTDNSNAMATLLAAAGVIEDAPTQTLDTTTGQVTTQEERPRRGRRSNAEKAAAEAAKAPPPPAPTPPAPVTASAPPPIAMPDAPPIAPATSTDGLAIPAFLARNADNSLPGAPPAPPAPPPAPPLAPSHGLAARVVDDLKKRAAAAPDKGGSLAVWLNQCNVIGEGATFEEAITVVSVMPDDKIAPVAKLLNVS